IFFMNNSEFMISCMQFKIPSSPDIIKYFFGNICYYILVIININNTSANLCFSIVNNGDEVFNRFNIINSTDYDFQGAATCNMAGHCHNNIQYREHALYYTMNIYFNNSICCAFFSQNGYNAIIRTYKRMVIQ